MASAVPELELLSVGAHGPDCASVEPLATIAGDKLEVRAPLKAVARALPPSGYAFHNASCTHRLTLRLPEGWRLVVSEVRYFYQLSLGGSSGATHGFSLSAGEPPSSVARSTPGVAGSADIRSIKVWSLPPEAAVRTGCGGEQTLALTMQALVRSMGSYRSQATIQAPLDGRMPGVSLSTALEECTL